jgi:formate dehydrogenase major subunit
VDPRFQRTAAGGRLSTLRCVPGSDIAFLLGIIRYALETKRYHADYVKIHTNASYIVGEKYGFQDGLFSGFDEKKGEYDKTAWGYTPDRAEPEPTGWTRRWRIRTASSSS